MLSILIPIYNTDSTKLVNELHKQCIKSDIRFEILCFDDCSKPEFRKKNQGLAFLFGVSYVELSENHGRAKIRNLLAANASNKFLLFLDSDSKIPNKSFIKNYIPWLTHEEVLYGGRSYQRNKPGAKKMLHWLFGTRREALPANKRNRAPYLNFLSNNFVIPSAVFKKHPFDPEHEGYGYEDTLFATRLMQASVKIRHIDNPLIHSGLENNDVFIAKTKNALDNLVRLYLEGIILETRLIKVYHWLEKIRLTGFFMNIAGKRLQSIEQNLFSAAPRLRYFDLWKLHYFISKLQEINPESK